jgi:excisionase family DNA binding protein
VLHAVRAVAVRLDASVRTVRRLIARGELPAHRIDRAVRVSEDDLRRFLAARRHRIA